MAWKYYRTITIPTVTTQTDFPMLFGGTYAYLATVANGGDVTSSSGYDIAFYSDAALTTRLVHGIKRYVATTGEIYCWIKVPTLATGTVIYLAYGDSGINWSLENQVGVFSAYNGVWPLGNGTTLSVSDWTAKNPTTNGGAIVTSGKVGGAANFNGTSHYITTGNFSNLDGGAGSCVFECWINAANAAQTGRFIMCKREPSGSFLQAGIGVGSINSAGTPTAGKQIFIFFYRGGPLIGNSQSYHTTNDIVDGTWKHIVAGRTSGSTPVIYINGVDQTLVADVASTTAMDTTNTGNFSLGYDNVSNYFTGSIDDARFIKVAPSLSLALTEYNNQNSPSTWYTVGSAVSGIKTVQGIQSVSGIQTVSL